VPAHPWQRFSGLKAPSSCADQPLRLAAEYNISRKPDNLANEIVSAGSLRLQPRSYLWDSLWLSTVRLLSRLTP
jgi:hypothetical protein